MDSGFATKLIDILIENSVRVLSSGYGVDWAESSFFAVIRLLRREKYLKGYFLEKVSIAFDFRDPSCSEAEAIMPMELIELVAHEMRWTELQELAWKRINKYFKGDMSFAAGDISYRIFEAYDDNWSDKDFYDYYSQDCRCDRACSHD